MRIQHILFFLQYAISGRSIEELQVCSTLSIINIILITINISKYNHDEETQMMMTVVVKLLIKMNGVRLFIDDS